MSMNPRVDFYFNKPSPWQEEFKMLRTIALDSGLTEELKWGHPCYSLDDKNIFLMHGFNDYCALLFFKGVLLKDKRGVLVQQTENVQAARQMRFTKPADILKLKPVIKSYIAEAVELENS